MLPDILAKEHKRAMNGPWFYGREIGVTLRLTGKSKDCQEMAIYFYMFSRAFMGSDPPESIIRGFSIISFRRTRKLTESLPSIIR